MFAYTTSKGTYVGAQTSLSGCGGALVASQGDDEGLVARVIADRARGADVVYLGEQHDNPTHHSHQRAVVEALVARGVRPALAFEMLEEDQQAAVDQALAGGLSAGDLDDRLRWRTRG